MLSLLQFSVFSITYGRYMITAYRLLPWKDSNTSYGSMETCLAWLNFGSHNLKNFYWFVQQGISLGKSWGSSNHPQSLTEKKFVNLRSKLLMIEDIGCILQNKKYWLTYPSVKISIIIPPSMKIPSQNSTMAEEKLLNHHWQEVPMPTMVAWIKKLTPLLWKDPVLDIC